MRAFHCTSAAAICVGVLGCGDPDLQTNLNSEGPPEITMVTVLSEARGEAATFCLSGTDVRVNRQMCPESADEPGQRTVAKIDDAQPLGWYTRVVFSELLDVSVEELVPDPANEGGMKGSLANTQPVTLQCGGADVPYDGYYDPSGNDVTDPAGPSLVIEPIGFVGTASDCTVVAKAMIADKDGNQVLEALRGPFEFAVAPLVITDTLPADADVDVDPAAELAVMFNAPIDMATIAGAISLAQGAVDVPVTTTVNVDDPTIINVSPNATLAENTAYTMTIAATGVTDIEGGAYAGDTVTVSFTTGMLAPVDGGAAADADTSDAGMTDAGTADAS